MSDVNTQVDIAAEIIAGRQRVEAFMAGRAPQKQITEGRAASRTPHAAREAGRPAILLGPQPPQFVHGAVIAAGERIYSIIARRSHAG